MSAFIIVMIGISFVGFIAGLAGKASSVKNKSMKKSEIFSKLTVLFLILMFVFAIAYQFVN
ncbi:MAG: hypothetical protein JW731_17595 [Bacteroidales bacterium]|nr:hypothetical protein [Bacteroidales bacterium]